MSLQSTFPTRLVQLHDGRPGLRGSLAVDVREPAASDLPPNPEPRTPSPPVLDFISSDETLDRYDEIIAAAGWRLDNYQRNPVFQNAHQYGDIIFTLGKALLTEARSGALFQRIQFATDANPMAKVAYALYKGKFLNAVSVGFIPIRWEDGPPPSSCATTSPVQYRRKYLEQELLEVSAVGIPANPNALALAYKSGAVPKSDLQDTLDLLRAICPPSAHQPASPSLQSLLPLARELAALLRHT